MWPFRSNPRKIYAVFYNLDVDGITQDIWGYFSSMENAVLAVDKYGLNDDPNVFNFDIKEIVLDWRSKNPPTKYYTGGA